VADTLRDTGGIDRDVADWLMADHGVRNT